MHGPVIEHSVDGGGEGGVGWSVSTQQVLGLDVPGV